MLKGGSRNSQVVPFTDLCPSLTIPDHMVVTKCEHLVYHLAQQVTRANALFKVLPHWDNLSQAYMVSQSVTRRCFSIDVAAACGSDIHYNYI